MKEILGFHLHHCPYCANAFRAIEELQAENPAFKEIKINWVEDQDAVEYAIIKPAAMKQQQLLDVITDVKVLREEDIC